MSEEKLVFEGAIYGKKPSEGVNAKTGKIWKRASFNIVSKFGESLIVSTFDEKTIEEFKEGDSVKANYVKSGTFNNLLFFEKTDEKSNFVKQPPLPVAKSVPPVEKIDTADSYEEKQDAKQKAIVRQNVLNRAVELFIAGKIEEKNILTKAEEFEKWVWEIK